MHQSIKEKNTAKAHIDSQESIILVHVIFITPITIIVHTNNLRLMANFSISV